MTICAIACLSIIILSGCTEQTDVTQIVRNLPETKEFLAEHPDARIVATKLDVETVEGMIEGLREECGQQMEITEYWHLTISEGNEKVEVYADSETNEAVCIVRTGIQQADECTTDADCNDSKPETEDTCIGTPKKCQNTLIQTCKKEGESIPVIANPPECCAGLSLIPPKDPQIVGIEGYCTAKCGNGICNEEIESSYNCQEDCRVLATCSERGGDICNADETCPGNFLQTSDSSKCCSLTCVVEASCSEQGGKVCSTSEYCIGHIINASDTTACCTECTELQQCNIPTEQIVREKMVWDLPELCEFSFGGSAQQFYDYTQLDVRYISPEDNDQHSEFGLDIYNSHSEASQRFDLIKTQVEAVYGNFSLKEINGNEVFEAQENEGGRMVFWISENNIIRGWNGNDIGTVYDDILFDSLTEEYLEKYPSKYETQDTNTCATVTCSSDKKCVNGECILKTCNEIGGNICMSNQTCPTSYVAAADSTKCCSETCTEDTEPCGGCSENYKCVDNLCYMKTCSELGGMICNQTTEECSIQVEPAGDSVSCCLGTCNQFPYDVSISGPVNITSSLGGEPSCYSSLAAEIDTTSTFPETASMGHYEIYLDGQKIHTWTPLNVEPGTNKFYARLDWADNQESFQDIKIVFSCGDSYSYGKEANCENNTLEATVNYEKMQCS